MRYEIYFHFPRSFCPNEESHPVQTMTSGCDNLPKETLVFRECVHIFGLRHPSERYIGHFSKKESLSGRWTCNVTTVAHQSSPHTEKRLYFPKCFIRSFLRTQLRTFSTQPNSTRVIGIDLRK